VALIVACGLARAQGAATSVLPSGSELTFISDDVVDPKSVHAGSTFKVHLLGDVVLDGETIAASGTIARLLIVDRTTHPDGSIAVQIALGGFRVRGGDLPVVPLTATVGKLAPGTTIHAKTMGSVERVDGRVIIRVPPPFVLPAEAPNAFFTPVPARTAQPRPTVRARTPTPTPTPTASPTSASSQ
jgi:hypothetical protein